MSRISLYTGGSRSGKSRAAVDFAMATHTPVCFIATCEPQDDEMHARVDRHKAERPSEWNIIEEPLNLANSLTEIESTEYPTIIVDCLTLWVSNLMLQETSALNNEDGITNECNFILEAARDYKGHVIFITNEVGLSVIPDNSLGRRFVDLAGRCNQVIAQAADDVILFSCGLPIVLKGSQS